MAVAHQTDTAQSPNLAPSKEHSEGIDTVSPSLDHDIELQVASGPTEDPHASKVSAFKSLGLLDRFLAVWILLAMIVGVLLGNFVPNTGPALQKGQFVGVSVPIGKKRLWLIQ
jgi:ACR3 family arsenite transporter